MTVQQRWLAEAMPPGHPAQPSEPDNWWVRRNGGEHVFSICVKEDAARGKADELNAKMAALKRCPFCGAKLACLIKNHPEHYSIRCDFCWASTGMYQTEDDAIEGWNERRATWFTKLAWKITDWWES